MQLKIATTLVDEEFTSPEIMAESDLDHSDLAELNISPATVRFLHIIYFICELLVALDSRNRSKNNVEWEGEGDLLSCLVWRNRSSLSHRRRSS